MKDFFVSYNRADRAWAEWIAWTLEEAGYTVVLQSWDFRPGGNFILEMQKATTETRHTALVLSDSYLAAEYTQPEWAAAFAEDPRGERRRLIPLRVAPCQLEGLLRSIIYVDLVGLSEEEAEAALLGAPLERAKPPARPSFPGAGAGHEAVLRAVPFPATASPPGGAPRPGAPRPLPSAVPPRPGRPERSAPGVNRALARYLAWAREEPLIGPALFPGTYQVEPPDLLHVVLREVRFRYGEPARALRVSGAPLAAEELAREMAGAGESPAGQVLVLLGEAGVGKTTLCKWLRRHLAGSGERAAVPVYVPLGHWDAAREKPGEWLERQVEGGVGALAAAARRAGRRLLFLLDGCNELRPEDLRAALGLVRGRMERPGAAAVLTSRPLVDVESLWPGEARYFEIGRWSEPQLAAYLEANGRAHLLAELPPAVRDLLRLPLLAFLFLRLLIIHRAGGEPLPALRSVADVLRYVVEGCLGGEAKSRVLEGRSPELARPAGEYLEELAFRMTGERVVQTEGRALEAVLDEADRPRFGPLLLHLVESGLLRSPDEVAALDPRAAVEELRVLRIGFLHQALQEYLTARRLLGPSPPALPPEPSRDAFWREVPVYLAQSQSGAPERQNELAMGLLAAGDPLTAARIAGEVADPGLRRRVEQRVARELVEDIGRPDPHPYVIEAFAALGEPAMRALRERLDPARLAAVFTLYEAHLVAPERAAESDEEGWRPLGRAIYVLGELGDPWLAHHLGVRLHCLCSLHLAYHAGEALLSLARSGLEADDRAAVAAAGRRLADLERGDAVTRAQACAVHLASGGEAPGRPAAASELGEFLREQQVTARAHFQDEFWRRAHGVEALAEVSGPERCREAVRELFAAEDGADYGAHEVRGYRLVQSSILKAVHRSCDQAGEGGAAWRPFLELVFESRRIAENGWACRHLEHLLARWFGGAEDRAWLRGWGGSRTLGGERIGLALANVLRQVG